MDNLLPVLLATVAGYLLGSLPFAVIISKLFGLADPRSFGSGNPGATNVLRTGNKLAAVLTLVGDAAKGWVAMLVTAAIAARFFANDSSGETAQLTHLLVGVAGIAAFLGHVFPFTLGFQGGKGVATALGVMLGFEPALAGLAVLCWLGVALTTRYSSLASLTAAVVAPLAAWWLYADPVMVGCLLVMSAVLILRHRSNISKLIAGTESKIGSKSKSASA